MTGIYRLSNNDSIFISYLRGLSIFIIVFGHVGGFWFYRPYSEFLHVFVPIFFFISGAVSFYSYNKVRNTKSYFIKRITGLIIPYYLTCVLALVVFLIINQELPVYNIDKILKWIMIKPSNDLMPFPLGQIWFIHTLFFIILLSPLFFMLHDKLNGVVLLAIMYGLLCFSGVQLFFDVDNYFQCILGNLYKPVIHSFFFIFGIFVFSKKWLRSKRNNILLSVVCFISIFLLVYYFKLNIDLAYHTYAPDLYYVSVSILTILVIFLFRDVILVFMNQFSAARAVLLFFHKHTFSIFLLHSFAIFLSEKIGGLVDPPEKTIAYGLLKLSVVLIITCIMSVPFTKISNMLVNRAINYSYKSVLFKS